MNAQPPKNGDGVGRSRKLVPGRHGAPPVPPVKTQVAWRATARFVLRQYFDLSWRGEEHVPRGGPGIVISNHPSYLDPFFVGWAVSRWITWMTWEDAFSWPVLGRVVERLGGFPVDLDRPRPSTLKTAFEVLARDRLLGIFFEGGRSLGFDLDEPRRGAARIAVQAGVPVVPVTVAGVRRLWPRDGLPRPGPVTVHYHPRLDPADFGGSRREREEALTRAVARSIRSALPADGGHRAPVG